MKRGQDTSFFASICRGFEKQTSTIPTRFAGNIPARVKARDNGPFSDCPHTYVTYAAYHAERVQSAAWYARREALVRVQRSLFVGRRLLLLVVLAGWLFFVGGRVVVAAKHTAQTGWGFARWVAAGAPNCGPGTFVAKSGARR